MESASPQLRLRRKLRPPAGHGNTLVSFGMSAGRNGSSGPTEAYEVSAAGIVVWHLTVSGTTTMFRVEPVTQIAGEVTRAGRRR